MGTTQIQRNAATMHRSVWRGIVADIERQRIDAGISRRQLARAAGVDPSFLGRIELGTAHPSIDTIARLAAALGADLSVRLYPTTGPPIRDRHQARMVEALLRILHPRWHATLEVPVRRPARGVIDLVLHERVSNVVIAVEAQSEIRRVEQQLRWFAEKAESLPSSDGWRTVIEGPVPRIGRLLLLRSTRATRALVSDFEATFASAYPSDTAAARQALTTADAPWPGDAIVWVSVGEGGATVLERRPPGVRPRLPRQELRRG